MYKFIIIILVFVTCLLEAQHKRIHGNLVIDGIPKISQRISNRTLQYRSVRSASLRDWHPSGLGVLISTRFNETKQIHYVTAPGAARSQLTFFREPVRSIAVCPQREANAFLFTKDVGGSECYQIYLFNLADSTFRLITDGRSKNGHMVWSNKGDRFCYFSTKRNGKDWDIYITSLNDLTLSERVFTGTGRWIAVDWSPTDKHLLLVNYISINESYYHILNLQTRKLIAINPGKKNIAYGSAHFSRDGKGIYLTSDENNEFKQLKYYNIQSQRFTTLTQDIPWDVSSVALSNKRKLLAFIINENGISRLQIMNLATNKLMELPTLPIGQIYGLRFNRDDCELGIVCNSPQTPGDIYSIHLPTARLRRWTYSEVGGLDNSKFVVPKLIHYPTFDKVYGKSRMIPAFYYKPKGKGPFPSVIWIHGGPESQYRPYFNSKIQYMVNELGIAVLAPNVRGSSGYGKSYLKLDNGLLRENSVKDIGSLLDWIEQNPELNQERVAVVGGSYGGYMVLASMIHYNHRLRAGIDRVGISNFVSFLQNTKAYRRDLRRVEYGDERDPQMREFLHKISPTTNAHKITKPILIVQGLNDPRVPATESEQMVKVIRNNGGKVWYLLAKDEGHGFRRQSNRSYYTNVMMLFLEKTLGN